jgi:hypothetical protein
MSNTLQTKYNSICDKVQGLYFYRARAIREGKINQWDGTAEEFVATVRGLESKKKQVEALLRIEVVYGEVYEPSI